MNDIDETVTAYQQSFTAPEDINTTLETAVSAVQTEAYDEPDNVYAAIRDVWNDSQVDAVRLLADYDGEPHINRSRSEALLHDEDGPTEQVRLDAGGTWFHDRTGSAVAILPYDGDVSVAEAGRAYAWALRDYMDDPEGRLHYSDFDVYRADLDDPAKSTQEVGICVDGRSDYVMLRACWYMDEPDIHELVTADMERIAERAATETDDVEDPDEHARRFEASYCPVTNLYDRLASAVDTTAFDELKETVDTAEAVIPSPDTDHRRQPRTCILSYRDEYLAELYSQLQEDKSPEAIKQAFWGEPPGE